MALFLWALSGAIVGWRKGFDSTGVFVVALVSATGGGLLRDGLLLNQPSVLLDRADPLIVAGVAMIVVAVLGANLERISWWGQFVAVIDAVGTPMFAVIGSLTALNLGVSPAGAVFVGAVNGVGGGLLRDLLVRDVPQVFQPGQYDSVVVTLACAAFTVLMVFGGWNEFLSGWLVVVVSFTVRLLIIRYNWRSMAVNEWRVNAALPTLSTARSLSWPRWRPWKAPSQPEHE